MTMANGLSIGGVIVDIVLFLMIAGNAVLGYRRGLTRVVFNICSTIVAFILVLILYKPTANYMIHHTKISENLESVFEEKLQYLLEGDQTQTTEQLPEDNNVTSILQVFISEDIGEMIHETTDSVVKYISVEISHKIISVVTFFVLYAVIRLLLYILKNYAELIAKLPIIRLVDGSGGMIYGIIKGFLIIYAIFAIISIILPMVNESILITSIQSALVGSKMFHNNIILNLIFKFL